MYYRMAMCTYCDLHATMVYTFRCTIFQCILIRFNSLEDRDEILQVFFNSCNLGWSVFDRVPESVKLDTGFSKLESN